MNDPVTTEAESLAAWLDGLGKQYDDMSEAPDAAAMIRAQAAEIEKLRAALSWFLEDNRFVVSVGGNPIMVDKMLACARAILEERAVVEMPLPGAPSNAERPAKVDDV